MCGIIAYRGEKDATQVVINGLKKLEYRGYDSWGIAIKKDNNIHINKKIGKIGEVQNFNLPESNLAIGHSRWATHGGVTAANAHPHFSCNGKLALIHNGIIENFQELRRKLSNHTFTSQTDTEVIVHLIEEYSKTLPLEEAFKKSIKELEGNYAIILINSDNNDILAARKGSPLVLGVKDNEYFLASDVPAFLEYTNQVIFLDNQEFIKINENLTIKNLETNENLNKPIQTLNWSQEQAEKGTFPHFMLKEIFDQKDTIKRAIAQDNNKIQKIADEINEGFGTFFIACGTSYYACLTASYIFSSLAQKHINVVLASEFENYKHFLTPETLVIPVSQSGETADVLEAVKFAKEKGSKIISLVNVFGSSLMRTSAESLLTNAGPEIAVASTKAFTSQVSLLTLLAYASISKLEEGKNLLKEAAEKVDQILTENSLMKIRELAKLINKEHLFTIGRGCNYSIALESALKIKEVSYVHAEGFAGGELKHGTLALIEEGTPCIVYASKSEKEILNNAMEIKARGGFIVGMAPEENEIFDYFIKIPDAGLASAILNIIPAQLLAYYLGIERGCNIDKCRNLAKSVTVK